MLRKIKSLEKITRCQGNEKKMRQKIEFPSQALSHSEAECLLGLLQKLYLTSSQSFLEIGQDSRIHSTGAFVNAGPWGNSLVKSLQEGEVNPLQAKASEPFFFILQLFLCDIFTENFHL